MHSELCKFISTVKPEVLILIHGESESIEKLIDSAGNYASRVEVPSNGSTISISH